MVNPTLMVNLSAKIGEAFHRCGCTMIKVGDHSIDIPDAHLGIYVCPRCQVISLVQETSSGRPDKFLRDMGLITDEMVSMLVEKALGSTDSPWRRIQAKFVSKCIRCKDWQIVGATVFWKKGNGIVCPSCYAEMMK